MARNDRAAAGRGTASAESTETALAQSLGAGATAAAGPDAAAAAPALSSDPIPSGATGAVDPVLGAELIGAAPLADVAGPLLGPTGDPLIERDLGLGVPEAERPEVLREIGSRDGRTDFGPGVARAERIPARVGPRPALDVGELAREEQDRAAARLQVRADASARMPAFAQALPPELRGTAAPISGGEAREHVARHNVMHDGVLRLAGEVLTVTRAQFDDLRAAGAVEGPWF